jgi:hypothetical protein
MHVDMSDDDDDEGVPVTRMSAPAGDNLQTRFKLAVERTRASKDISGAHCMSQGRQPCSQPLYHLACTRA